MNTVTTPLAFVKGEVAIYVANDGSEYAVRIEGTKGRWVAVRTLWASNRFAANTPINCARAALAPFVPAVAAVAAAPRPLPPLTRGGILERAEITQVSADALATPKASRTDFAAALRTVAPKAEAPKPVRTPKVRVGSDDSETVITGMSVLHDRLKEGKYTKAANGQPCCGDQLAIAMGALPVDQVINACIIALAVPGNLYTHLNIGQQSMNLRNRVRGALKRGDFGWGVVAEAIEVAQQAAIK